MKPMQDGEVREFWRVRHGADLPAGWEFSGGVAPTFHDQFSRPIERDAMTEPLPDDNPKTVHGVAKPGLHSIPVSALLHLGQAMEDGRRKYGLANWRQDRVSASTYYNAILRHLMAWWDGQDEAPDSKLHHLAHAMACMAILLDADEIGKLNDDRPTAGNFPEIVKRMTKEVAGP